MAEMTEQQLASINAFLQTNPNPEALAAAQAQYGVSNADLARAREYGAVGSAPGSNVPNQPTGPVVGGGGYDANFRPSGGTVAQGFSRDYTPEQMVAIRGTFKQYENDPQKLMSLMSQYGVNVNDVALAMGGSVQGYQNKFLQAGASNDFGGMSDQKASAGDKSYIDWMLKQPNPAGQGTLADVYKRQGIDPYTDPRVITQAREQAERQVRRDTMRAEAGAAPAPSFAGGPTAAASSAPPPGSAMTMQQPSAQPAGQLGGQAGGLISSQIASPRATAPSMATVGARPRRPQGGIVNSALMDPNTNFNEMVYGDPNNRYVSQADANKSPTIASMLVYNPYYANKAPGG